MSYHNPIPSLDDELQSKDILIKFSFDKPVTKEEAAENLNNWLSHNEIELNMIKLVGIVGIKYLNKQTVLGEYDRDPKGYGPRGRID